MRRTISSLLVGVALAGWLAMPNASAAPLLVESCPHTATRSIRVTKDLTCAGTAIVVARGGITIDLGGHVLRNVVGGLGSGVTNSGNADVTVTNGVLRGFPFGVFGDGASPRMRVHRVTVVDSLDAGVVLHGDRSVISSSVVVQTQNGSGVHVSGRNALIHRVESSGNRLSGVRSIGNAVTIDSVHAFRNGTSGVRIEGGSSRAEDVTASGNGEAGIHVRPSGSSVMVRRSTVVGNAGDGLLTEATGTTIKRSALRGNGGHGISVFGAASVIANQTDANGLNGINIRGAGSVVEASVSRGNVFRGIAYRGDGNVFTLNRLTSNGEEGIRSFSPSDGNSILDNEASGNGYTSTDGSGLGIDATADTNLTAGENIAHGNFDPDECAPASLGCAS